MDRTATRTVAAVPPRSGTRKGAAVAAVIVTYNPPDGLAERVRAVREQLAAVYLVDNASDAAAASALQAAAEVDGAQLLRLERNEGLGAALNMGVALARRDGYALALLLDHDSTPAPDMVRRMLEARRAWSRPREIVALAPEIDYAGSGIRFGWYPASRARNLRLQLAMPAELDAPVAVLSAIGSGLLVDVERYAEIGGMREGLFIDGVDTEFCLRACAQGFDIVGVPGAKLHHHLGHIERHRLLGAKDVWPTHHAPLRHYYIARNRIHVARRYAARYPGWFVFELRLALINIMNMLLFERQRGRKLWMIAQGSLAGLLGRLGPRG